MDWLFTLLAAERLTYAIGVPLILLVVIAPKAAELWRARQQKQRELRARICAIEEARAAMDAAETADTYFPLVRVYLRTLDPQRELPNRAELDRMLDAMHLCAAMFDYDSVDWAAAHFQSDDYTALMDVLRVLDLNEMVLPVRLAQLYKVKIEEKVYKGLHADFSDRDFETASDAIGEDFDQLGGWARVKQAAMPWFKSQMDPLAA